MLLQLTQPTRGTTAMAQWLVGPAFEQLAARFPGNRGVRVILDMRQMTGRSATARALLLQRARMLSAGIAHTVVIPSLHMGSAYLTLVEATVAALRLAGVRVELEDSIERVVAHYGVRAIRPSGQHPVPDAFDDPTIKRAADRS
jgi:hypothetical protein